MGGNKTNELLKKAFSTYLVMLKTKDKPFLTRLLLTALHSGIALWRTTVADQLLMRAANLSYWTLVAAVPCLILAFALMGPLGLLEDAGDQVKQVLYDTILAASIADVGPWLDEIVSGIRLDALGVLGFLGVITAGSKMYSSVEAAYNDIFGVRNRRHYLIRLVMFYAVITLGPLLLSLGFVTSSFVTEILPANFLARLIPVTITALTFIFATKLLPQINVKWKAAIIGGITSAILFEFLKTGFSAYTGLLGAASSAARLYGSLWLVPVFLFYIWLLWAVVLLGVEVAYVVHNARSLMDEERDRLRLGDTWNRHPDLLFGLQVFTALASINEKSNLAVSESQLAEITGANNRSINDTLFMLETAGLVLRVEGGGYVPSMPIHKITAAQVMTSCRRVSVPHTRKSSPGVDAVKHALSNMALNLNMPISDLLDLPEDLEREDTQEIPLPNVDEFKSLK